MHHNTLIANLAADFTQATGIRCDAMPDGKLVIDFEDAFKLAGLAKLAKRGHLLDVAASQVAGSGEPGWLKQPQLDNACGEVRKVDWSEAGRKSWVTRRRNAAAARGKVAK